MIDHHPTDPAPPAANSAAASPSRATTASTLEQRIGAVVSQYDHLLVTPAGDHAASLVSDLLSLFATLEQERAEFLRTSREQRITIHPTVCARP